MIYLDDAIDAIEMLLEQSEDDEHDTTWNNAIRGAINAVKHHTKSAQPERKKGKWILVNGKTSVNCSYCYHCSWSLSFEDTVRQFNFCPNCGAKMEVTE